MIETIIIAILTTALIFTAGGYVYQYLRYKRLLAKLIEMTINNVSLNESINKINANQENPNIADPDGFIKFLSQSREWAFNYIEEVQEAILKLSEAMQSANEDKIHIAYLHLMTYLPNEKANNK
jgi:hypothetical protein